MDTAKLETTHYLKLVNLTDEDDAYVNDATVTAKLLDADDDDSVRETGLTLSEDGSSVGTYELAWTPSAGDASPADYAKGDNVKLVITATGGSDEALEEILTFRIT